MKSFGSCFECGFKAHFTLGVKAKVEFKSNIPIRVITTINPKGFTLKTRSKNKTIFFNLPFYGPKAYQLGRLICNP
jgi:hypothetical protein